MASRNQYTYTPGYGVNSNRQSQQRSSPPRNAGHPSAPRRPVDAREAAKRPIGDTVLLTMLFIVAPFCGILGLFFTAFLWVFIVVAMLVLVAMWALRCFEPKGRAFVSGILAVLIGVSLIAAFVDASSGDQKGYFPQYGDTPGTTGTGGNNSDLYGSGTDGGGLFDTTPTPATGSSLGFAGLIAATAEPTPADGEAGTSLQSNVTGTTPSNGYVSGSLTALENYLRLWQAEDYPGMVNYTLPSWRAAQGQNPPQRQLNWTHSGWLLNGWTVESNTEQPGNDSATIKVIADMTKNTTARTQMRAEYSALVVNYEGTWYVDPDSMRNFVPRNDPTESPSTGGDATAGTSEPPAATISPSLTLWYNSDGGLYYHTEEKCSTIDSKNYKYMKSFKYSELNDSKYSKLNPCSKCGAPKRP